MKQDDLSPIGHVHETERVYLKSSVRREWLADIGRHATTIEPRAVRRPFLEKRLSLSRKASTALRVSQALGPMEKNRWKRKVRCCVGKKGKKGLSKEALALICKAANRWTRSTSNTPRKRFFSLLHKLLYYHHVDHSAVNVVWRTRCLAGNGMSTVHSRSKHGDEPGGTSWGDGAARLCLCPEPGRQKDQTMTSSHA
jgi:hypothetical protein